jgi:hypothetical protein
METEGTSPCSNLNPEPVKACPRTPILFFKVYFNIIHQFTPHKSQLARGRRRTPSDRAVTGIGKLKIDCSKSKLIRTTTEYCY